MDKFCDKCKQLLTISEHDHECFDCGYILCNKCISQYDKCPACQNISKIFDPNECAICGKIPDWIQIDDDFEKCSCGVIRLKRIVLKEHNANLSKINAR